MTQPVETLLTHYESGRMSRRDLVALADGTRRRAAAGRRTAGRG